MITLDERRKKKTLKVTVLKICEFKPTSKHLKFTVSVLKTLLYLKNIGINKFNLN